LSVRETKIRTYLCRFQHLTFHFQLHLDQRLNPRLPSHGLPGSCCHTPRPPVHYVHVCPAALVLGGTLLSSDSISSECCVTFWPHWFRRQGQESHLSLSCEKNNSSLRAFHCFGGSLFGPPAPLGPLNCGAPRR
jgi:hypothetical protein